MPQTMPGFVNHPSRNVLITAGAGFIGTNLAAHLLATTTARITLCDNLSLPGTRQNYDWLTAQADGGRIRLVPLDPGNPSGAAEAAREADEIYHLECARRPQSEGGELTAFTRALLEAARSTRKNPVVIFASSRNVIGSIQGVPLLPGELQPRIADSSERHPSPANEKCTKCDWRAAAEHLVLDYAQIYGLPAAALRFDTLAGPRQAVDGQDWVAQLVYSILNGLAITSRASLNEVRDVLHVADAVEAMLAARAYIGITTGKTYDVGGGTQRCVAVLDLVHTAERICNRSAVVRQQSAAVGEPTVHGAKTWPFRIDAGWHARRSVEEAVRDMVTCWLASRSALAAPEAPMAPPRIVQAA